MRWLLVACGVVVASEASGHAQIRLADETDRAAFRAWFVLLADAQFYRQTSDVTDCAALVRHAVREALRAHTPEWIRRTALPFTPVYADVRHPPRPGPDGWALFRISDSAYAEFADAHSIIRFNATGVARDPGAARPGDLLFFPQTRQGQADHVMVFVGSSVFDPSAVDWLVYHTGPDGRSPGEVRKVRLHDLVRHPSPRWRPLPGNAEFAGVYRLALQ
jgi:uncharacterized protein